ncbi:MAG: hypothetical protein KGI71_04595 [Patescibacteria group bacterium]|nr:hypothetical protein [Patescibacteria group bacterium]
MSSGLEGIFGIYLLALSFSRLPAFSMDEPANFAVAFDPRLNSFHAYPVSLRKFASACLRKS